MRLKNENACEDLPLLLLRGHRRTAVVLRLRQPDPGLQRHPELDDRDDQLITDCLNAAARLDAVRPDPWNVTTNLEPERNSFCLPRGSVRQASRDQYYKTVYSN